MVKHVKLITLFLLAIILFSCKKVDVPQETYILGKGGMGIKNLYPMNSAASYYLAAQQKIDGIEIDCQITQDGELIAFHDEFLDQITNYSGSVYAYSWEELKNNAFYDNIKFKQYTLISVKEIINIFDNKNIIIDLDCKINNYNNDPNYLIKYTNAILEIKQLAPNIIIENNDPTFLEIFKNRGIDTYVARDRFLEALNIAVEHNNTGIVVADYECNEERMKLAEQQGIKVVLWQSQHSNGRNLKLKPYIYQTNDIKYLKN